MQKTIKNMAVYIKNLIPIDIPTTYTINPIFKSISNDENIRKGVLGFRNFLYFFFDYIIADNNLREKSSRDMHEFMDNISLPIDFPFLNNLSSILVNIGFNGTLAEDGKSLLISDWQLLNVVGNANLRSQTKMATLKFIEGLRYLNVCGINFDGIDLNVKKIDLKDVGTLIISYPNDPIMLIGLKAMATAQKELRSSGHEDFFLCCNYRVLKVEDTDVDIILKDFTNPMSKELENFVLKLHQHFLDAGLTTNVEIKYFRFRFIYYYKSKEVCMFSTSLNGYALIIKSNNILEFPDILKTFPLVLQQKILKGFGCYRKTGGNHCEGACQGYRLPLDESLLAISHDIKIWLDIELSGYKKRK